METVREALIESIHHIVLLGVSSTIISVVKISGKYKGGVTENPKIIALALAVGAVWTVFHLICWSRE